MNAFSIHSLKYNLIFTKIKSYMRVFSIPVRLKCAVALLLLCVPLIALQVIVTFQSPWWNLPLHQIEYWSLAFSLICLPLCTWLLSAKKWAFLITSGLSVLWVFLSAWIALKGRNPSLGFYTVFLSLFLLGSLLWIRSELGRSFLDPQLFWYQGLPKPIPGLSCRVSVGDEMVQLRVSRFDQEGAFVFEAKRKLEFISKIKALELSFQFRERKLICKGAPVVLTSTGNVLGVRFLRMSSDFKKEIGDFVEVLRGEGYV